MSEHRNQITIIDHGPFLMCGEQDDNNKPTVLGVFPTGEHAQYAADVHNRTHGPGLRAYIVPAGLMWSEEDFKVDDR